MLTESFLAATLTANKPSQHLSSALKDTGIFLYELQPQTVLRHGFKKSSVQPRSLAVSRSHLFAAQTGKAVINVYNRNKGNQEATVPFPSKVTSIAYADGLEVLVLGTEEGKLILWEVGTGRISTSAASHLEAVTQLCPVPHNDVILSASSDSTVLVWSIASLLSFESVAQDYSDATALNAPIATFSQHRDEITVLGAGHSRRNTNFAISASADQTCHIWHIETCEVIRTVLLPSTPISVTLDPADRAIYLGDAVGSVTSIDLLALSISAKTKTDTTMLPVQIPDTDQWRHSSAAGAAHAVALSYDGTVLLTGHDSGEILRWDIAKRKVANEVANLGQPITNLYMLRPDGLRGKSLPGFAIQEVVKPKLEFNAQYEHGSSTVPANYKLHVALTGRDPEHEQHFEEARNVLTSNGWTDSLLDDAVRALESGTSAGPSNGLSTGTVPTGRMEDEVAELKKTVAAYKKAEMERMERSLARMEKREDIDLRRRQAYHDAIKRGEDKKAANAAMKAAMDKSKAELMEIDAHSDAEAFTDTMDTS